jgi:hypothetical protein
MGQSSPLPPEDKSPTILDALSRTIRDSSLSQTAVADDEDEVAVLAADLRNLAIEPSDLDRFFGKSSGAMLFQRAIEAKRDYADPNKSNAALSLRNARTEFWIIPEVCVGVLNVFLICRYTYAVGTNCTKRNFFTEFRVSTSRPR